MINTFIVFSIIVFVIIMLILSAEILTLKPPLTLASALVLILGSLRVMPSEKSADYYMHSAPFIAKMIPDKMLTFHLPLLD